MSTIPIPFTKYHGNGNDFILIDMAFLPHTISKEWLLHHAPQLCHRHTGIGGDGIIVLNHQHHKSSMTVINADGSLAYNCGNGLRCAASYLFAATHTTELVIEFMGTTYAAKKIDDGILVSMGACTITRLPDIYLAGNKTPVRIAVGEIKNRHLIVFSEYPIFVEQALEELKTQFAIADVNVGFLTRDEDGNYLSRVFERGVGFTNSCGSGASAAAAFLAYLQPDVCHNPVTITQPGGSLTITLEEVTKNHNSATYQARQWGKAVQIFTGIFQIQDN